MQDKEALIAIIRKYLREPYVQPVIEAIRPSVRMVTHPGRIVATGDSRLGGIPDLPVGVEWPCSHYSGMPLSFLAQLRLEGLPAFEDRYRLPGTGMLYFFFDLGSCDDGRVLYHAGGGPYDQPEIPPALLPHATSFLSRLLSGKPVTRLLEAAAIDYYIDYAIPSWDSVPLERLHKQLGTRLQPLDAYDDQLYEALADEGTPDHRLLGHYNAIQHQFYELDFVPHKKEIEDRSTAELEAALEWQLLFQIDSDKHIGLNYADAGRIYFFIHKDDLAQSDFSKVRVTADCY